MNHRPSLGPFVLAAALAALPAASFAETETVAHQEVPYGVKYPNGAQERYVAKYRGEMTYDHSESGGPAKPFEGKFIDDRQCHWNIATRIVRSVCLTNQAGQQFCDGALNHVYGTSFANGGSDFMVLGLRSENCGDADARYRSDLNDARRALKDAMDGVVSKDAAKVSSQMKLQLQAASVDRGK